MKRIFAVCIVWVLAGVSTPALAFKTSDIKPVGTPAAMEWQLGGGQGAGDTERRAELYFVSACPYAGVCPGTLIVTWHSIHGFPADTVLQKVVSVVDHVYRTGLNTYRVAVSTGFLPASCGGAGCERIPPLGHKTLYVDTWARTVTN